MQTRIAFALLLLAGATPRGLGQSWLRSEFISPRGNFASAYDHARDRVVLFGGLDLTSAALSETWEWDGATWSRRLPATEPELIEPAMAWDGVEKTIVLFGMDSGGAASTWAWDGVDWRRFITEGDPGPRRGHAMVWDSARRRVLLFGGRSEGSSGSVALADTWEWDGDSWAPRSVPLAPAARYHHAMAYDEARQRVVLFGGIDSLVLSVPSMADTWEWDGAQWLQRFPSPSPTSRWGHGLAYDALQGRIVLFGGRDGFFSRTDTWQWDGAQWVQRSLSGPLLRWSFGLVWDRARGTTIAFLGQHTGDTWRWDGTTWTEATNAVAPPAVSAHAMAFDEGRGNAVLVVPRNLGLPFVTGTWVWTGGCWQHHSSTMDPGAGAAMTYDSARARVISFGGMSPTLPLSCFIYWGLTREWDGANWITRSLVRSPPPRAFASSAYHEASGRTVLFGGLWGNPIRCVALGGNHGDTWEWDGTTWSQRQPPVSPAPRSRHAMAYDKARRRTVLFGGADLIYTPVYYHDTWEWDGSSWIERFPVTSPPALHNHAMAYDTTRQRVVLFGGQTPTAIARDLWEWDGDNWTLITTETGPTAPVRVAMAYDPGLQRLVLHGGADASGAVSGETWLFGATVAPATTAYGSGCGPGRPLELVPFGSPSLGNRSFALDVQHAAPAAYGAVMLALGAASVPLGGGCALHLDPGTLLGAVPVAANGFGFATLPLAIPPHPALARGAFHVQALMLDPQGPAAGLSFTGGLRVLVGG